MLCWWEGFLVSAVSHQGVEGRSQLCVQAPWSRVWKPKVCHLYCCFWLEYTNSFRMASFLRLLEPGMKIFVVESCEVQTVFAEEPREWLFRWPWLFRWMAQQMTTVWDESCSSKLPAPWAATSAHLQQHPRIMQFSTSSTLNYQLFAHSRWSSLPWSSSAWLAVTDAMGATLEPFGTCTVAACWPLLSQLLPNEDGGPLPNSVI